MEEIKEGQVWSYKSRKIEEESRVTVIKIDHINDDIIVHLKIDGLMLIEKISGEVISTSIEHLPISLKMFKKSICKIESTVETSLSEGYQSWKKLFDYGKAGVWYVEIANAIEMTEETYNE